MTVLGPAPPVSVAGAVFVDVFWTAAPEFLHMALDIRRRILTATSERGTVSSGAWRGGPAGEQAGQTGVAVGGSLRVRESPEALRTDVRLADFA
jgi:hypothetical protein